jgi:hypothetical protein
MTPPTIPATKGVTEAATDLVNFAWSTVVTDCTESAEYLNDLVDNLRVALAAPLPAPREGEQITRTVILREWFGGDRYARDHEYLDTNFGVQADRVVSYLEALSPTAPELGAVKALPWQQDQSQNWFAETAFGQRYFIYQNPSNQFVLSYGGWVTTWDTSEAAKAAAQADFEARILSTLVLPVTPNDQPETDEMQPDTYTGGDFNGVVRGKRP